MRTRTTLLRVFLGLTAATILAGRGVAELMTEWFPDGLPGYDMGDDVTPETRLHPDQTPSGIDAGAFDLLPHLDQGFGYSSNVLPGVHRAGSWQVNTAPSLGLASDWLRDAIGAYVAIQNTQFLSAPSQDRTDVTASAGGRLDIGEDNLTLAVAHIVQHEDRTEVDTIASDRPIAYQVDNVRAAYSLTEGPWRWEPSLTASHWQYAATTIQGTPVSEAYRDRVVLQGDMTLRYELAPLRSLLLVLRDIDQTFTRTPVGQPSPNSNAEQLLAGIDYDQNSIWRLRLLLGLETRHFSSPLYPAQNNLIAEGALSWSPDGMTTVHAVVSRNTGDAAQAGVSGLTLTTARLTMEHEYLRDLLFKATLGWQQADMFGGGQQSGTIVSAQVTKVLNRNARVSIIYSQTELHGAPTPADPLNSGFSRGVGMMTVSLGL